MKHIKSNTFMKLEFAKFGLRKKANKDTGFVHDFEFYTSGTHLDYITRDSAVYLQDDNVNKSMLKDEFKTSKLSWREFLNSKVAQNNKSLENKSGLYRLFADNPTDLDKNEEKKLLSKISTNQNVWEMIINLGENAVNNFCIDKFEWNDILNDNLKSLLQNNNINPNNITGHWVIHANTEFPHLHLQFWEKVSNVNNHYRSKGTFKKSSLFIFRELILKKLTKNEEYNKLLDTKKEIWSDRKSLKNIFELSNTYFSISKDINTIKTYLKDNHPIYSKAKENIRVKEAIWKVFDYASEANPEFKSQFEIYKNHIKDIKKQKFNDNFNKGLLDKFLADEEKELENQFGNLILKACKKFDLPKFNAFINNDNNSDIKWLMQKWEWELDNIYFQQKRDALAKFNKNIKVRGQLQ